MNAQNILKEEIRAYRNIEQFHLNRIPTRYDDGGHRQGLANEAKAVYTALENILARLDEPEYEYAICRERKVETDFDDLGLTEKVYLAVDPETYKGGETVYRRRPATKWEEVPNGT